MGGKDIKCRLQRKKTYEVTKYIKERWVEKWGRMGKGE
jgi:hypothetical protein